MKNTLLAFSILTFLFFGCSSSNSDSSNSDSTSASKKQNADSLPHEVRYGKVATYPYLPDTSIRTLVLGNHESFRIFYRDNGANMNDMGNDRFAISYFNGIKTEEIELLLANNANKDQIIYAMILQKYGDAGSPLLAKKPLTTPQVNYISGNGIYIGMSQEYVMLVYTDQALTQSRHNDTIVLQYKPMKKDEKFFKRYPWNSYTAIYKFVDNQLCRMEYSVDPKEFEEWLY